MEFGDREFNDAVVAELEQLQALVIARRDALFASGQKPPTHEGMARAFALGALDNAIWNLIRRARGPM